MVYESDFYTRRTYSRPTVSSYTVSTPRYDMVTERPRTSNESKNYSYSYKSVSETSSAGDSYARPKTTSYSTTSERTARSGPGGDYNYSTARTSTTGGGPGGYSYSSTTSGRLPQGTTYRHYSYRV